MTETRTVDSALARLQSELEDLRAEHEDLRLLYEATIEHGEAVEDQLAEKNILLERTRARLEAELAEAAHYVMSILPEKRATGPATDWLLVPSTELGGDSFGYHDIDADHFAIYLVDVCGHGVGAALLSVTVMNVLRSASLRGANFRNPSAVLHALNNAFPMERQNGMFFTCWYGVYRRSTGRLSYASGGHPPAIHIRGAGEDARTRLLAATGSMVIGAIPNMPYKVKSITLRAGDRLLVLSDGAFEIDGPDGEQIGLAGIADYCRSQSDSPAQIFEWVSTINGGASLPDDFSLLRIRF